MKILPKIAFAAAVSVLAASQALANPCPPGNPPTNCAPPPGAILDLNGMAILPGYNQYSTSFVATATSTNLSFAFREDPAFLFLDDVSVTLHGDTTNLVVNGGFEDGPVGANAPNAWTYLNSFGATFAGVVENNNPHSGNNNYYDGAVQAYDGITQALSTTVGATYDVTFWLADNSGGDIYRSVSTNGDVTDTGGNGIDLLVYGGAVPTLNPVPEPETYALMLAGLGVLGAAARRRTRKA